ncbi:hypothetical protein V8C37DRAFT_394740 [Trichoderma ceciliae]
MMCLFFFSVFSCFLLRVIGKKCGTRTCQAVLEWRHDRMRRVGGGDEKGFVYMELKSVSDGKLNESRVRRNEI